MLQAGPEDKVAMESLSNMRVICKPAGKTKVKQHSAVLQLGAYRKQTGMEHIKIAASHNSRISNSRLVLVIVHAL